MNIPGIFRWCTYPRTQYCNEYHLVLLGQAPQSSSFPELDTSGHTVQWGHYTQGATRTNVPGIWRRCRLNTVALWSHRHLKGSPKNKPEEVFFWEGNTLHLQWSYLMNYRESIQGGLARQLICHDKYALLQSFIICISNNLSCLIHGLQCK